MFQSIVNIVVCCHSNYRCKTAQSYITINTIECLPYTVTSITHTHQASIDRLQALVALYASSIYDVGVYSCVERLS